MTVSWRWLPPLEEEDESKLPEVLADRWVERVIRNAKRGAGLFEPVIPPADDATVNGTVSGLRGGGAVSVTVKGRRDVEFERRETFEVPGGEGAEFTLSFGAAGTQHDRRLYLAVIKAPESSRLVVVAYGNTREMFEKALPDAVAFAHRVRL